MGLGRIMDLTIDNSVVNFEFCKKQDFLGYLNNDYYVNIALFLGVK